MSNKAIVISVDCVIEPEQQNPYPNVLETLGALEASGDAIVFLSHDFSKLKMIKRIFPKGNCSYRKDIRNLIKTNSHIPFVIIGCHDEDFYVAVNTKNLYINAGWTRAQSPKSILYGLSVPDISVLNKTLSILKNHSAWYFQLNVDEKTKVYSLMNARTKTGDYSAQEIELVTGFQNLLKQGRRKYFSILLHHFLAGIVQNQEFKEIQDWGIFPSSGLSLNPEMEEFKERARVLMGGKKKSPIFKRHTPIGKSHYIKDGTRIPCDRHFNSISINPEYKGKLVGRAVCIMDDYLTNGTSFETARNLLSAEGVRKMIFVSMGTFGNTYYKQDYSIEGDVTTADYRFSSIQRQAITGDYNDGAMKDITELANLLSAK